MRLIIAEKPSVAAEIASVLHADTRRDGYFEGKDVLVSWCVGHLVGSAMPEEYDPSYKQWNLTQLPFIPDNFRYQVLPATKAQFYKLVALTERKDMTELVCATDAGREGELIFRLFYRVSGCNKPFKRLWISSMESSAILGGFNSLKDSTVYDNLYFAALERMKADYLVGINATRYFSLVYGRKLNVGRVQTPTLNLVVKRHLAIKNFKSSPYFILAADCGFRATKRVDSKSEADRILTQCAGQSGTVSNLKIENKAEYSPALYDLTSLQREANSILGLSAQQTLDIAQSLYEKKILTYPRTDSRYLTEDMRESTLALIINFAIDVTESAIIDHDIAKAYDLSLVDLDRVINNKKVSDHHAIIPTAGARKDLLKTLSQSEASVFLLVLYRFLSAPYAPMKYSRTTLDVVINRESFSASGKQVFNPGYRFIMDKLYSRLKKTQETEGGEDSLETSIPKDIVDGLIIKKIPISCASKMTQPPKLYTEGMLLLAMETAGRDIEDDDLREAMKGGGLGTPATRAGIIEKIIAAGFVSRRGKAIDATDAGIALIKALPDILTLPELTADWEMRLHKISSGELDSSVFSAAISDFVRSICSSESVQTGDGIIPFVNDKVSLGSCPRCGKNIYEFKNTFSCESGKDGCGFTIWKNDRFFVEKKKKITSKLVSSFLADGRVRMQGLFSIKHSKTYDADVEMIDTGSYVNFKVVLS